MVGSALALLVVASLIVPAGSDASAEPAVNLAGDDGPKKSYDLAPDGRPWTTGDYQGTSVDDQWALWPACAPADDAEIISFTEAATSTVTTTATETNSRDDFCIESVTVVEVYKVDGPSHKIDLEPVLAGTRDDGTAR